MSNTSGKFNLNLMTELCDTSLITALTAILSISCILALLLIIPATIQFLGSLITEKNKIIQTSDDDINAETRLEIYELDLYRYRILFNVSVFLIVMGSSIPLLIHLINVRHQNKGHIKIEETTYEYVVSIWGICHFVALLDIGGRIFFALMVTIPTVIICLFFMMKKTRLDRTFRLIMIMSFFAFIFAYTTPTYLLANLWKKRLLDNDSFYHCVSHKRSIFYSQLQMFELLICHLLPVLVIVPSILYTWITMRFTSMDVFYEPIIFVVSNVPFLVIDVIEQVSIAHDYDFSGSERFANFYMVMLIFYHLSYTCMFLVAPIRSMFQDNDNPEAEKSEVSNVYNVLIQKDSMRRNFRRQYSVMIN